MKIPIDRYKLLGVAIGSESRAILDQLERRQLLCKYSGFSADTMNKRKELLAENCNILLDTEKKREYDESYKSCIDVENEHTTDVTDGCEIAGLLLLLESGEEEDCLSVCEQLYREQRMKMSYFSTEYRDLNRIMDYATIGLAEKLRAKRHYQTAAEVLERRIKNHNLGMGEKKMINMMCAEFEDLLPFRILDLLSREKDDKGHEVGIELLQEMIRRRGGLDGQPTKFMGNVEFQAFFRQIRKYISVQEQIMLYEEWKKSGSESATFLLSMALVAQGFAQRKPNRIYEALRNMEEIRSDELEPVIANMLLLLGDVKNAERVYNDYADIGLKEWCAERTNNSLGALCEWCREWLSRDVLKGYKDIEIEADIESYFADVDVISYIEDMEGSRINNEIPLVRIPQLGWMADEYVRKQQGTRIETGGIGKKAYSRRGGKNLINLREARHGHLKMIKDNLAVFSIITISTCSLLLFAKINTQKIETKPDDAGRGSYIQGGKEVVQEMDKEKLLTTTLYKWHMLKKATLAGNKILANGSLIATERLLEKLEDERKENARLGNRKEIDVSIRDLRIINAEPERIKVVAELEYSDKTLDKEGKISRATKTHTFQRNYNFRWKGGRWLVDQ